MTALQGLVLGCLGAPRGSLEMYPEAGRTEGNLSYCDDPMRLGGGCWAVGIPSPHPPDPNIQVLFKNREASQIIS